MILVKIILIERDFKDFQDQKYFESEREIVNLNQWILGISRRYAIRRFQVWVQKLRRKLGGRTWKKKGGLHVKGVKDVEVERDRNSMRMVNL